MDARKRAYNEGYKAFLDGETQDGCPYPTSSKNERRYEWMCGYLDARTRQRLGHVFDKWELKWP